MAQPPSLRIQEQVIEEFGVSRKYTILLIIFGLALMVLGVVSAFIDDPLVDAVSVSAGPLGPLIFWVVEGVFVVAGLSLVIRAIYLVLAYHYFLTNERIIQSLGFLAQNSVSADYRAITDLTVRQDFINRLILNTGTLTANTPGGPGEEVVLLNIDNPQARREQLRQLADAAMHGARIDRHYLAQLKTETGMAEDVASAEHELERDEGIAVPGVVSPRVGSAPDEPSIPNAPAVSSAENPEDFNQDGRIDESERLRAAQKKV